MALLAASCQKEELHPLVDDFTATAVIRESVATKVDYTSDPEANEISQQWSVGDKVIGFDNLGQNFTFTVSSIDAGKATFSLGGYAPGSANKAYAVFYPGEHSFSNGTLAVDITNQNGILSTETPVLMCATADITGNSVAFEFENQAAVIEVKKFQIEPGKTVSSLKIGGLAATGTFQVVDGEMVLVPSASPSTITASVNLTADGDGVVDTPVFFAALATQNASITVQAVAGGKTYDNANAVPVTNVEAGHLYYMSKKLAQVARVGNATYSTLAAALAASSASHLKQTVEILRDFTESALIKVTGDAATLDLAGHDVEARIEVDSELDLMDSGEHGRLWYTGANPIKVNGGGKLIMNSGTVEAITGSNKAGAVYVRGTEDQKAEAVINGGTLICDNFNGALETQYANVTVNGGRFEGYVPMTVWRYSDVTINDAEVECTEASDNHGECILFCTERTWSSDYTGSMDDVNVTINGGTFKSNECFVFAHSNGADVSNNANLQITGGYFTWPYEDPDSAKGLLSNGTKKNIQYTIAGGHYCDKEFDNFFREGDWFVPSLFTCDDQGYQTLESAFAAAKSVNSGTIKMYVDYKMASAVTLSSGNYTLDLQGHDLAVPGVKRIDVTGGSLSVTSSVNGATYTQTGTADQYLMKITGGEVTVGKVDFTSATSVTPFFVDAATFTFNSGSVNSVREAVRVKNSSTAYINGGSLYSSATHALVADNSTLNIDGGTFLSEISNAVNASAGSVVSVKKGTFNSRGSATAFYVNASTATIEGGTFESTGMNALSVGGNADVTVSGGTFKAYDHAAIYVNGSSATISAGSAYSTEHLALSCEDGADIHVIGGNFETGSGTAVYLNDSEITIEGGTFKSPDNYAIHTEGENGSVAEIKGGTFTSSATTATFSAGYFSNTNVTLDEDCTFESDNTPALKFSDCPSTTIKDGTFKSKAAKALIVDGYSLTIDGGTFESETGCALSSEGGAVVTVNGGSFTSTSGHAIQATGTGSKINVTNNSTTDVTVSSTSGRAVNCVSGAQVTIAKGNFSSGSKYTVYSEGNGTKVTINGGSFDSQSSNTVYISTNSSMTINDGTFTSAGYATMWNYKGTGEINGGSFTSTGSNAAFLSTDSKTTFAGGTFFSDCTSSAMDCANTSTVIVEDGTFHSAKGYAVYIEKGANVTAKGGLFVADEKTAAYVAGTDANNTLTVTGGTFICNNEATVSADKWYYCYALYVGGSGQNVTINKTGTSEPCFYTKSSSVNATVACNSSTHTFAVQAGYFNKGTISASMLSSGYSIKSVSPAKTVTVGGNNYSFGYRVEPD